MKLGYYEPFSELDCITAEAFLLIDAEVEALKAEEMEKASKKMRKR